MKMNIENIFSVSFEPKRCKSREYCSAKATEGAAVLGYRKSRRGGQRRRCRSDPSKADSHRHFPKGKQNNEFY
jgi:hypothetical protein